MGDVNYFNTRNHYVFITYKDMIKLVYPVMIHDIIKDYYEDLKDVLRLDEIKNYDIFNLERICVERTDINPLKYLKKPGISDKVCDDLLRAFNEEMIEMYTQSKLSLFGAKLYNMFTHNNIKEFYIYIEEPAHQIIIDMNVYFSEFNKKIKFFTGNFIDAVMATPNRPTCFVLNDVNYVQELIEHHYIEYTEIIIGELGCNFELNEDKSDIKLKGIDEDLMKKHIFKIGTTPVLELGKQHFTQFDVSELDDKLTK